MAFEIIYTNIGLQKLVLAETGTPLVFEKFAVGDGKEAPNAGQTKLQNEKWRGFINSAEQGVIDKTNLLVECVIPSDSGINESFYIKELGLFDTSGDLIAIASVPESYYAPNVNGLGSEKLYNITLKVSNDVEIDLQLDTTILATQSSVKELNEEVDDLASEVQGIDEKLTNLTNSLNNVKQNFQTSLTSQIGKIIINLNPLHKDKTLWNDGIFEYALCNGQSINSTTYPKLAEIYGSHVPNFQGTLRHLKEGDSRALGSFQDFAIENIKANMSYFYTHYDGYNGNGNAVSGDGAINASKGGGLITLDTSGNSYMYFASTMSFDASRVVKTSTETRMANTGVQLFVIARLINT